ncbi:YlxR family protein [Subtercola sp. YIM 133946]|uniref:YlxR family protein n=1 Tax=Subtercola sp. YIM 133946 TaxID=3118909 RepID=UPI002F95E570
MNPVRTCVGCRARAEKSSLLRIVVQTTAAGQRRALAQNPVLVVDEAAVLPGRGAYVHPTQACFDSAVKRRAFARALRLAPGNTPPDTANLQTRLNGIVNTNE